MTPTEFAPRLLAWFDVHGRHDLPWQHPRSAYRVWLAEIMLQQTQVATVIPYYQRFLAAFPDLPTLAAAERDAVLGLWSGLGYYSRARNLHAAAQRCVQEHGGDLPADLEALAALPGIGRSTAAAICAQAFGQRTAILDGNVKRVLCRAFGIDGWPGQREVEKRLWELADTLMPGQRCADYTQAIMDLGATVCRRARPDCAGCPLRDGCAAYASARVAELPQRKPGKALPQRYCEMLVLLDDAGRVLLQRRPETGVWAGLWSLPEFADADARCLFANGNRARDAAAPLPGIDHVFSHYRLRIAPYLSRADAAARIGDNTAQRWATRAELAAIGLPAPIRRLLATLTEIP
jgi:A/G-specific adenine glycosylase